jgi:exodeoxyribonuclease III
MGAPLRIGTWNVNSLKVRLPHLLAWLEARPVDIVCLQETKLVDDAFPVQEIADAGYRSHFAGQKTYNGVAILLKSGRFEPASDVRAGISGFEDPQQRLISLTVEGMRIVCAYFPNGQAVDSEKYRYKLKWIDALKHHLESELRGNPRLALLGDFNIAPEDRDVHDPALWAGQILCSEPERAAFRGLVDLGLQDTFRRFEQPARSFTWWDYRNLAYQRKLGLRIDLILMSEALARECTACQIDVELRKQERPSDHVPVVATIEPAS